MGDEMKKGIIILIGILMVYLGVMYIFFGKKNISEQNANEILLIHYNTKFQYNNYKWQKIGNDNYTEYEGKKYNVYNNGKFFGNYELMFNKKWYMFDDNNNSVKFDFELFAHYGKKELKFINYEVSYFEKKDIEVINKAIKLIGIEDYKDFYEGEKLVINYDDDMRDETIYIVKGNTGEKVFTLTFLADKKEIKVIDSDVLDVDNEIILKVYRFHSIIDIGNDNEYEIIIAQDTFGEHIPYCHYMLYKGHEVDIVTSCESR